VTDDGRDDRFDHLFAERVRATLDQDPYGSWRAIDAPDAVSLSFGFPYPASFPNDELVAAAADLFEAEGDSALQYGGGEYAGQLSEVVAARERERGVDCDPEQVVLTSGASHAIDQVCRTVLEPGDPVFLSAPTFMGALSILRNHGPELVSFPVDEAGMDVDAVAEALATRRAADRPLPKLLYVVPNFQNPTGVTLSRDRRERILELAAEYDFLVLEDDAYGDLRYDGEDVPPLAALDDEGRVIRTGTFSKTIAPGVRTGWAVAHEAVAAQLSRTNAGRPNTFTRGVLARYCEAGHLEATLPELRAAYAERRDHMLACLAEHLPAGGDWTEPEGGFFVWVTLPAGLDADDLLEVAADEGVTYLPGEMFYPDGGGERSLRLSFSHVSMDEMGEGVAALGRAVEGATEE
jgi:2-aminoadipate transaminase